LTSLFFIFNLDLGLKNLRLELALVVGFNAEALMVQTLPEDLGGLLVPNLLPLAL